MYSLIIVGGGLIGSACARHASERGDLRVALVGPSEQADRADTEVHGCWHDEGRLYNLRDGPGVWGALARHTVPRLLDIEARSGVKCNSPVGFLGVVGPRYNGFQEWIKISQDMEEQSQGKVYDAQSLPSSLLTLSLPAESTVCWEQGGGHLSPRALVEAQIKLAKGSGCEVVPSLATSLEKVAGGWQVTTASGRLLKAKKVVLAQGTYTATASVLAPLLPPLALTLTAQTLALIQVDSAEACRLASMPTMVVQLEPTVYTYILPPVRYPDGQTYIKFGAHDLDRPLTTQADVINHYRIGPDPGHVAKLVCLARRLLPGLAVASVHGDSCVTSNTPGKLAPFIDTVGEGLVLAAGGCGHAAKGCDEIGRIAAVLALEERWDSELPRDVFKVQYKSRASL